jgi:hypothetical protein
MIAPEESRRSPGPAAIRSPSPRSERAASPSSSHRPSPPGRSRRAWPRVVRSPSESLRAKNSHQRSKRQQDDGPHRGHQERAAGKSSHGAVLGWSTTRPSGSSLDTAPLPKTRPRAPMRVAFSSYTERGAILYRGLVGHGAKALPRPVVVRGRARGERRHAPRSRADNGHAPQRVSSDAADCERWATRSTH